MRHDVTFVRFMYGALAIIACLSWLRPSVAFHSSVAEVRQEILAANLPEPSFVRQEILKSWIHAIEQGAGDDILHQELFVVHSCPLRYVLGFYSTLARAFSELPNAPVYETQCMGSACRKYDVYLFGGAVGVLRWSFGLGSFNATKKEADLVFRIGPHPQLQQALNQQSVPSPAKLISWLEIHLNKRPAQLSFAFPCTPPFHSLFESLLRHVFFHQYPGYYLEGCKIADAEAQTQCRFVLGRFRSGTTFAYSSLIPITNPSDLSMGVFPN